MTHLFDRRTSCLEDENCFEDDNVNNTSTTFGDSGFFTPALSLVILFCQKPTRCSQTAVDLSETSFDWSDDVSSDENIVLLRSSHGPESESLKKINALRNENYLTVGFRRCSSSTNKRTSILLQPIGAVFRNRDRMEHLQEPVNIKQEYIYGDAANSQTNFPFMKEVIKQEMDCKTEPDIESNPRIETGMLEHEQLNQTNYHSYSTEEHTSHVQMVNSTDVFENRQLNEHVLFGGNRDVLPVAQTTRIIEPVNKNSVQTDDVNDPRGDTNYCRFSSEDNISHGQMVNNGDTDMFGENRDTLPDVQITRIVESIKKKDNLKSHKVNHTVKKPYKCVVYGGGFTRSCDLKSHTQTHTGEKPHKCDICGVCFTESQHLKLHKRIHTGEKPYKCDICGVCFTQSASLKLHKRIHTGEKPYKCDICGVCFTWSASLKQHKRIHTGEKPYKCDICGVCFTQPQHLKLHKRIHTGEKPCKCDICGVCFAWSASLKLHKRIHTVEKPYKCDVCNADFKQFGMLKLHMRTHTGEKLYKCDCCGACVMWPNLKLRKITDRGDKSYLCGACFTWSDELKVQNMTYLPM